MRTLLPRFFLTLALLAMATPVFATKLWQDAELGMSPETIKGLYPEAGKSNGNTRGVHGVPRLVLKDYAVNKRDFNVEFYFDDAALQKVILRLQNADLATKELPTIYRNLLASRYGEPMNVYTEGDPLPLMKLTWLDGQRDITLYWALIRKTRVTMSIIYSSRIADEAGKL